MNRTVKCLSILGLILMLFINQSYAEVECSKRITMKIGSTEKTFRSGYIKVGETNYHYIAKGDSSKPMILFLHGFPEIAVAWKDQLSHFSKDYYAVAVDMKGANLTSIPAPSDKYANYSAAQIASEINTLALTLTGGRPYHLVGHDWGGTIAWNVAFSFPQSLSGLVVINAAHSLQYFREYFNANDPRQFDAAAYVRNIISGDYTDQHYLGNNFAELRKVLFENSIGNAKRFFNDEMRRLYTNYWLTPGSVNAGMNYYRAINIGALAPLYAENAPPIDKNEAAFLKKYHLKAGLKTLIIWGQKDIYISHEVNTGLDKFFDDPSDLTIKRYGQYSHWIVHENSDLVTKNIEEFLGKNSPRNVP